jgi:hypothetical protein
VSVAKNRKMAAHDVQAAQAVFLLLQVVYSLRASFSGA